MAGPAGLARDKLDYACRSPLWHAVSLNNEVAVAALLEARAVVSFDCLGKAMSAYGEQSTMHRLLMEPLQDRSRRELILKIQLSMVSSAPDISIMASLVLTHPGTPVLGPLVGVCTSSST